MVRIAALALLVGCGKAEEIEYPALLSPLEEVNQAPAIAPVDGDPHPEVISFASGAGLVTDDGDEVYWAHARAYVKEDAATVWQAVATPEVVVDRREVDEWSVVEGTVAEFDPSFTVHNKVNDIITVEYETTWVHELQEGTEEAPELVMAAWDKTDGTSVIDILSGTMVLTPVEDGVTELQFIQHMKAALRDEETIVSYLQDVYDSVVAEAHGEPLPTYE